MNVNKVMLVGRLTRDPELRTTPSGQTVATIGLATGRVWNDKNGQKQERTEFHNIVVWGRMAEICGQYLIKGQEAFFEGRLETRKYTGKDGVERRTTEIIAENMQLGSKPMNAGNRNYNPSAPASTAPKAPQANSGYAASSPAPQQPKEEEIPTINLDDEPEEVKIEDVPF